MTPVLTVTAPAASLCLLSPAELRAAVGITNAGRDADLLRAGLRISSMITGACKIRGDGIRPATFFQETLTDTFRIENFHRIRTQRTHKDLVLSRRRISTINSVTVDGTVLDPTLDYAYEPATGLITRLCAGVSAFWIETTTEIEYVAGFKVIPDDLKMAAEVYLQALWRDRLGNPANVRDPLMRQRDIPGVISESWWVDPKRETLMPPEVLSILDDGGYIEVW